MNGLSTKQVAKKLGMSNATLSRYILMGKVPAPPETMVAGMRLRLWNEEDIERLRIALPKAKNGRKTRYQKLREKQKAQPKKAVPRKSKKK
jgi:predicted DNA-binding transcriptional regulator AlpA